MREIVCFDLPMSPMDRTQWWVGIVRETATELENRLKEARNLQEAMVEVVEVLHRNLQADSDRSGMYDPMGTLN